MAKLKIKENIAPKYMEAARRMLKQLGINTGELAKPEDVREALLKTLKEPDVRKFGSDVEVVREDGRTKFIFHANNSITVIKEAGRRSFLFVSEDGAGFVEYGLGGRKVYTFYSESAWSVEKNEEDYFRERDGKVEKFKVRPVDYTKSAEDISGRLDETLLDAYAILEKFVGPQESEAYTAMAFTDPERK